MKISIQVDEQENDYARTIGGFDTSALSQTFGGNTQFRSASAPPMAENVASNPIPMYAPFEPPHHDAKYYYQQYAPGSENPRLPVPYATYTNMHRNNQGVVAPNAQAVSELTQYFERTTVDEVASAASQAAFEAAVAAAGGVPMTDLLANNDSSDSNQSGKTLIDRIQEDFPRTPSPVYGTLFQGSMGIDAFPNIHPTEKLDGRTVPFQGECGLFPRPSLQPKSEHVENVCFPKQNVNNRVYKERGCSADAQPYYPPQASIHANLYTQQEPSMHPYEYTRRYPRSASYSKNIGDQDIYGSKHHNKQGSAMLESFRSNLRPKKWDLQDIFGHAVEFAKDQHGSRFIQQKLEVATLADKNWLFEEMYAECFSLMTDVFGNYVIQKFLDFGSASHRLRFTEKLRGNVVHLSLQLYGCRVVQKALEVLSPVEQTALISELQGYVMSCVKDQNGNHVIQKCIEIVHWNSQEQLDPACSLLPYEVEFVIQSFFGNVQSLATHPYGCRVIQRVLQFCTDSLISPILQEIYDTCYHLVQDQYGNYVVQHVLEKGTKLQREELISRLIPYVVQFSQHKFASNVIERCVTNANDNQRHDIIIDVLSPSLEQSHDYPESPDVITKFEVMMRDPYANYVVQKLIDIANESERKLMILKIKGQAAHLKRFTYGRHILARLEKLTGHRIVQAM